MARPRAADPVVSTTISVPTSFLLRLQTLNTHRVRRGLATKSPQALMREIIEANLTAYEAFEGYLWNPVANASAPASITQASHHAFSHVPPPVAPPGLLSTPPTYPLPPPPPQAPTYIPTDAPTVQSLLAAAQEQRLGTHQDLSLDSFFAEIDPQDAPPPGRPG